MRQEWQRSKAYFHHGHVILAQLGLHAATESKSMAISDLASINGEVEKQRCWKISGYEKPDTP
jgi:hypothetical protein